ncbi:hypothetical protein [Gramella sp. KN1008]|uniref:hypothetical protein n=1 Tax=Gramella sp. KN1008 TaxID=2529298 RepID=UPI0010387CB5|nr:hypothetical protein [Gramella sp. KN1008]TBW28290.1 hypothetical protein EZJ28_05970 [Gramella sp. KN1008]
MMIYNLKLSIIVGWLFGVFVLVVGIMNLLRGNDPGLGVTYVVLSVIYFPPVNRILKDLFGFSISYYLKAALAILIIWVTLAVGAIAEGYYPEILLHN